MKKVLVLIFLIMGSTAYFFRENESREDFQRAKSVSTNKNQRNLHIKKNNKAQKSKTDEEFDKIAENIVVSARQVDPRNFDQETSFDNSVYYDAFLSSFRDRKYDNVIVFAENLLKIPDRYRVFFWYGDLCHSVHIILGKVYLAKKDLRKSEHHLIKSVDNKCIKLSKNQEYSPILSSFGPDRSLAFSLYKNGKKETVIAFFEKTKSFWKSGLEEGLISNAISNIRTKDLSYEQEDDPSFPFEAVGYTVDYNKAPMSF